jgi:hypothetical protein
MANERGEKTKPATVKPNLAAETPVFSWVSPEFIRYKRDSRWHLYFIIIAIVLLVVLIIIKQWSGVALVAVASVAFIVLSENKPKNVKCAVYPSGVLVDAKVYDYAEFKHFWVSYGDLPKVNLQMIGRFAGQVVLPLGETDAEQVRLYLSKHLPEEASRGQDIGDSINKLLRM